MIEKGERKRVREEKKGKRGRERRNGEKGERREEREKGYVKESNQSVSNLLFLVDFEYLYVLCFLSSPLFSPVSR